MSYKHFTLEERECLQLFLSKGKSLRYIAKMLGRAPSSISREVNRNKPKWYPHRKPDNPYWYNSWRANTLSIMRRRTHARRALKEGSEQWNFVVNGLNKYWSPEAIAGRWHAENPDKKRICSSTIYRYVEKKYLPNITAKTHLRRRGKMIMPRSSNYNTIHPDRTIPEWPDVIRNRERFGDWEGDTVYGGVGKGLLITQVDRKSRFLCACLLDRRDAKLTKELIVKMMQGLPVESISLDNGSEFSEFRELEKELNTVIYFAEPHKPWQRGTNENTNDLIRFFFKKGFDFHSITQEEVDIVVDLINNRPRKCLGWKSPAEVFLS